MVKEARRRAELTQAQLAARIGTTQSAVARLERGDSSPSLARLTQIARACGLELVPTLRPADESDWSVASANLRLDVDTRVRQHQAALRFARAARKAAGGRRGGA